MPTTVYFATNRAVNNPQDVVHGYTVTMVPPARPQDVTYGTAFVDSSNLTADTVGAVRSIQDIHKGSFSAEAIDDLKAGGRNILVFIHGFANSFENAITRAAFNREWLAQCGAVGADTTVIAFGWPSRGHVIEPPFPSFAYRSDRASASASGPHIRGFFSNLLPILEAIRGRGLRTILLAHSMGNVALQAATESWFASGNGDAVLFDEALLAAADEEFTTFDHPPIGRLSALGRLARRISIYHSSGDQVLSLLSEPINGVPRLGQQGPRGFPDPTHFPSASYRVIDCSGFTDYPPSFQASHQYYRRSAGVRADITSVMA